ncbi:MAG: hypothetical protein GEEBNDBF_01716 [bacterium]|nr:hypothetical protein [bacterium]
MVASVLIQPVILNHLHHRWLYRAVSLLLAHVVSGCSTKGTNPGMPLTISPIGTIGAPDAEVQFSAEIDELSLGATYAWSFGDGTMPSTSTDATPTVILRDPGAYAVSLEITDGGMTHSASEVYVVAGVPVIDSVTPESDVGLPAGTVLFSAVLNWPNATAW